MRGIFSIQMVVVLVCVSFLASETSVAALTEQKIDAVNNGLKYLAQTQQSDGRWLYGTGNLPDDTATTAAVVRAFCNKGYSAGQDVILGGTNYGDVVGDGLNFIFNQAQTLGIGMQPFGNPDTNGNGMGVKFVLGGLNSRDTFVTGLVVPALVATGTPYAMVTTGSQAGRTYEEVVRDVVDYFAYGQVDSGSTLYYGGWRYYANYGSSDQSCTPYAIDALLAARTWDIEAPEFVESQLDNYYLTYIQNPSDGGVWYMPNNPSLGTNVYRTGEFLSEKVFVEDDATNPASQAALNFLNTRWQTTANSTWDGNFGNYGAMWATHKGLASMVGLDDTTWITNLRTAGPLDAGATWNWAEDYEDFLVNAQQADGRWPGYGVYYPSMSTAWSIDMISLPEPCTMALLAMGGAPLLLRRRRTKA